MYDKALSKQGIALNTIANTALNSEILTFSHVSQQDTYVHYHIFLKEFFNPFKNPFKKDPGIPYYHASIQLCLMDLEVVASSIKARKINS